MQPQQKINALDVTLPGEIKAKGVCYKEPHETLEEFLKAVSANETIIGFEFDPATQVLGIIIK